MGDVDCIGGPFSMENAVEPVSFAQARSKPEYWLEELAPLGGGDAKKQTFVQTDLCSLPKSQSWLDFTAVQR
jgi:hypothetical protein